jgi:beta-glucosidase
MEINLPSGFQLGVATSSWQIEGDVAARGRSIWDDFSEVPGNVRDGATGEPACDHVNRLDDDLDLLAWLGVDAYRFSFSWPRVQPGGEGPINPEGLDFYNRLIDGLLQRGIKPIATLYHWDLPSRLQKLGGWTSRATANRFADYAWSMGSHLGDRVDRWATVNEPWVAAFLGYAAGIHAPGIRDDDASLSAAYHLMLGHGLAVQALRSTSAQNIGIALNIIPAIAESSEYEAAAQHIDGLQNRFFLQLLAGGGVPRDVQQACPSSDWSFIDPADYPIIGAPIDWIGENYYTVMRVGAPGGNSESIGSDTSAFPDCPDVGFYPRGELTEMGWEVYPPGLSMAVEQIATELPGVPIWVTENGASYPDQLVDGQVNDEARRTYIEAHIRELVSAVERGVDVRGYLGWSLLDNLEWAEGWTKPFGLVRVDPQTQQRLPKRSAHWYRDLIASR